MAASPSGPLAGLRVVEFAGIGPAPFCGMLLADFGADVVRVDRAHNAADLGIPMAPERDLLNRGKRSIALDLKSEEGLRQALALIAGAEVLIEGFRPGAMERLGLGPEPSLAANPRLVYGRITGWGQEGPLAQAAGHDINYLAIAGALGAIGRAGETPVPPLNLIGDFGGGGVYLALGVVCAAFEARRSGRGQVVDAAMIDGVGSLMTFLWALRADGGWTDGRGANLIDGGAPWYDSYRARCGGYLAVGAIEDRFYAALLQGLALDASKLPPRADRAGWPALRAALAERIATRSRDEWVQAFQGLDACVAPVLDLGEVQAHPQVAGRAMFVERFGMLQPAPAPRFDRTPAAIVRPPPRPGEHTQEILAELAAATCKKPAGPQPDRARA